LTEDLYLRPVEAGDLDTFFENQRDPQSTRMAFVPARDRTAFDAHWQRILADESTIVRTIVWDGEIAGNVLSWQREEERLVGYWIGRDYWGRGIATRALAAFLSEDQTRPLHAHVATSNLGSIRVLEKCGFVLSGQGETEDVIQELVYELR
jgi:RimJ/RimL family protein N-acetyltransferase